MNLEAESSFARRWTIANTLALLVGYILYTPIAHGLSGGHSQGLSAFQILMHSLALAVVAVLVACAQRRELMPYAAVPWARIPLAVVGFTAAFWAGSYQPWLSGPDWDILFGAFVLGTACFLGVVPARGHWVAATIAVLAFPIGCFVGQLVMVGIVVTTGIVPDLQASHLQHNVYWIGVGVSMGAIGGWISGVAFRTMLPATKQPAARTGRQPAVASR